MAETVMELRGFLITATLIVMILAGAYFVIRRRRGNRKRPGIRLLYEAPGKTSAECRALLGRRSKEDVFQYRLEEAKSGGWYLHFLRHNPTGQVLDTLFLLQFVAEMPARFSFSFVREAFGVREPIIPEDLLDIFFLKKLQAGRIESEESKGLEETEEERTP